MSNSRGSQTGGQRTKEKDYSHDILLKEKRAKSRSKLKHYKGKRQRAKKSTMVENKDSYSRLQNLLLQKVVLMLMKM